MDIPFAGMPILHAVNEARQTFFKHEYDTKLQFNVRAESWIFHKVFTAISVPCNVVGLAIGTAGFALSACTLGAFKVAVYAATVGNVKLSFSTGCVWLGECTLHSAAHLLLAGGETLYDTGDAIYQGCRCIKWIGRQLHFDHIVRKFLTVLEKVAEITIERIYVGMEKSLQIERKYASSDKTPYPLSIIDNPTKKTRINLQSDQRPLGAILNHTVLSLINIPLNGVTAVCSAVASIVLSTLFVGKVLLYAGTGMNIPIPTFAGRAIHLTFITGSNVVLDTATDIGDGFITIYKTANAIGVMKAMVTALNVITYIPEALFG